MKVIVDNCRRPRAYADSKGECVILLEPEDDVGAIIREYTKEKPWYAKKYSAPYRLTSYTYDAYEPDLGKFVSKTITGDLIKFRTSQAFLG